MGAPNYVKQRQLDGKGDTDSKTVIVGDVNAAVINIQFIQIKKNYQRTFEIKLYYRPNGPSRNLIQQLKNILSAHRHKGHSTRAIIC